MNIKLVPVAVKKACFVAQARLTIPCNCQHVDGISEGIRVYDFHALCETTQTRLATSTNGRL
jgi:hypothetical protein